MTLGGLVLGATLGELLTGLVACTLAGSSRRGQRSANFRQKSSRARIGGCERFAGRGKKT